MKTGGFIFSTGGALKQEGRVGNLFSLVLVYNHLSENRLFLTIFQTTVLELMVLLMWFDQGQRGSTRAPARPVGLVHILRVAC